MIGTLVSTPVVTLVGTLVGTRVGSLVLVPNTLDLGATEVDLREVLPHGVIRRAATLQHWVAEDARSTRAFLKRVAAIEPLSWPLQELSILELPRPRKGSRESVPASQTAILKCCEQITVARVPASESRRLLYSNPRSVPGHITAIDRYGG